MAFTTHHVVVRGRLTNVANDNPALLATAAASTAEIDGLTVNGVDADLRKFVAGELTAIKAAIKQFVVDKLDFAIGTPTQVAHGDGTVVVNSVDANAPTETWTIQFLTPTTYSVTGSVTGATANGDTTVAAGVYDNTFVNFTATVGATPFMTGDRFSFLVSHTAAAVGAPTPDGGNTGDGTVTLVTAVDGVAVTETWTIAFTSATQYTVTGSVTGALATGDLSVAAGVYNNAYLGFTVTAGGAPFIAGDEFTIAVTAGSSSDGAVTHAAIGNGTVVLNSYNALAAIVETWTITFLTPTTYSVVGSVTGATNNGDTTVAAGVYDNGILNFTVTVGGTAFVPGDQWTIAVTF